MLVRIILIFLLFKYHKQIYQYLLKNKFLSLVGIGEKIQNTVDTVGKYVSTNEIKKQMLTLKHLDLRAYQEVKKRLRNIDTIYLNVKDKKDISLRNSYHNIKSEKQKINNRLSSIFIDKGLNTQSEKIQKVIISYINNILQNILDIRDRRGINTEWFEGSLYEPVSGYDHNTNYNYDFFVLHI